MARIRTLAGLPIEQYTSPNIGGKMSGHRGLVLHIAEGTYRGTISWQLNPRQQYKDGTRVTTSSTWIVGRAHGEWAQMVDSDTIAWTQRDGSRTWLSVELAGYAGQAPTAWQIEACAQLLAWCHREHDIPLQVATSPSGRGLGHHSMGAPAWGHSQCPGQPVIDAKNRIVRRAKEIVEGDRVSAKELWGHRIPPEAGVARSYSDIRSDGYRASTWVQYGYRWARRAAERASELLAGQAAILAKLDGADDGATRQAIRDELDRHRQVLLAEVREDLDELAELVRQRDRGELTAEQVVDEIARRLSGGGDDD